jgi:hypothetical protein
MIRRIFTLALIFLSLMVLSQESAKVFKIKFKDKSNSEYNIHNPQDFLSEKAIERRQRMGIEIKADDLPLSPQYLETLKDMGAKILVESKWMNLVIAEFSNNVELDDISGLPFVATVKDAGYLISNINVDRELVTENKPFFKNESYSPVMQSNQNKSTSEIMSFDYGESFNQIDMLNGVGLHNDGYTGEGMIISVLDAGFWHVDQMPAFDTLWANNRILDTRNIAVPGENVFNDDISSHGMMVLSTMGGNLPGDLVGTAPDAGYYLIRTEYGPTESLIEEYYWIAGAEYADSVGTDVINSSLGYTEFDNPEENHTYEDLDGDTTPITIGADKAAEKGILVVNSAGNYANDPWTYIGAPADGDSVFTIGAVDPSGNRASFSSIGPTYDGRVKPTVMAQGQATVVASTWGGIQTGNGTSFSSPVMAGMTACLWNANPDYSNMDIIEALIQSSDRYDNPDYQYGYGIPDFVDANNILSTTEIHNTEGITNLNVSPNPFTDRIQIRFHLEIHENLLLTVHDLTGRTVYQQEVNGKNGFNNLVIRTPEDIPTGIYILRIQTNSAIKTIKLIKS